MSLPKHTAGTVTQIGRVYWPPAPQLKDPADTAAVAQWIAQASQSVDRALLEIVTEAKKTQQTK